MCALSLYFSRKERRGFEEIAKKIICCGFDPSTLLRDQSRIPYPKSPQPPGI